MIKQLLIFTVFIGASISSVATERPPQFVNLAFDGSKSLRMWQRTTEFAKAEDVKFTYFISGVYFLSDANKRFYDGPRRSPGRSDIGFGGRADSVAARNSWVHAAHRAGHEVASHANGHFDGSSWSGNEWISELEQFKSILLWSQENYGGANTRPWQQGVLQNIIGFRAPLLGRNNAMFTALRQQGYAYDTSRVRAANHWPEKLNGVWDFPLASLRMAYSNKRTLSMDYNMYVAQSGGKKGNEANFSRWENEVYETYLKYFKANYLGNRAPLDIGHHFSLWNGGIYWRAMKRFTQTVCEIPEVVCGTYTDLVNFLDSKSNLDIQNYRAGNFQKGSVSNLPTTVARVSNVDWSDEVLTPEVIAELESQVCPAEAHLDDGVLEDEIDDGIFLRVPNLNSPF